MPSPLRSAPGTVVRISAKAAPLCAEKARAVTPVDTLQDRRFGQHTVAIGLWARGFWGSPGRPAPSSPGARTRDRHGIALAGIETRRGTSTVLSGFSRPTAALVEAFRHWAARRRRTAFGMTTDGGHPGAPLLVEAEETIERHGSRGPCPCRGPWHEIERAPILYDGQPMIVTTRRCTLCGTETTLYYRVAE